MGGPSSDTACMRGKTVSEDRKRANWCHLSRTRSSVSRGHQPRIEMCNRHSDRGTSTQMAGSLPLANTIVTIWCPFSRQIAAAFLKSKVRVSVG